MCPVYMAYGMTYDEFWHCDPKMYIAYREAHKLDIKRRNEEMWLQGLYNFEAFSTALSNIHFDNKSHKVHRYREEPFDIFKKPEIESKNEAERAKQKVIDQLNAFKARWDTQKRKGKINGNQSRRS